MVVAVAVSRVVVGAEVAAEGVAQSTEMGVMFTVVAAAAVVKGTTAW